MNFIFEWQNNILRTSAARKILFLPQENKIHIFKPPWCSFYYIDMLMKAFLMIFRRFPKIFPKLFRRPDERSRTYSENFRKFPKMSKDSEDCRRLSRKTRKCFDDTPTNLSTI